MSNSTELSAPAGASGSPPEGRPPFRARLGAWLGSWLGARPGSRPGAWPAVVAVAVGTFAVVTTEMLPVGLLTSIGSALGVSDGTAGLAMTVPGLVAALAAPLLTVTVGRYDRRLVLCGLMVLLAVANLLSALAPGFAVLLFARVLVGVSIGGVWSIAGGLAVRLVPERSAGHATTLIFSGIAVASVLGVPIGTLIGDLVHWRVAFAAFAALSLAVAAAMAVTLPSLPATGTIRLREVPGLFRN
ncbi:MFS transporter, partial [Streptomyces asiaticus]